ncbi:thiopurine S-methyltransferase [Pseudoluteimonas lycopersici]|uniref:Thiopurine S-methyltransferase n=1 Tax=Pseudoluteimonas lycopersici TaxID=1324796 RepID=A0A516V3Z1_9GAMM|nr:thiopurine S-methyltransferase [Lysobacter lycopersici]QDQ73251.1 thiopurine S-methyltransferase [Lysobacter lycopersici]
MNPDFWHQRWHDNQIGFHQSAPTPLLLEHWPSLGVPAGAKVFVPLAGKSLDMLWFASQGHRVLGVELSRLAVEQFFAEHDLQPGIDARSDGTHYRAGDIEIINGDAFALDESALQDCAAVFDRAALIALPPDLRTRYVSELYAKLPAGCRGLLVTLEYPQVEREGPPFSVPEDEVRASFGRDWNIDLLERRPIPPDHPGFVTGVSKLDTAAYALRRR